MIALLLLMASPNVCETAEPISTTVEEIKTLPSRMVGRCVRMTAWSDGAALFTDRQALIQYRRARYRYPRRRYSYPRARYEYRRVRYRPLYSVGPYFRPEKRRRMIKNRQSGPGKLTDAPQRFSPQRKGRREIVIWLYLTFATNRRPGRVRREAFQESR